MTPLVIADNLDVPAVNLSPDGNMSIIGKSFPENTYAIYKPIIDWFDEYVKSPASTTILTMDLVYFNSSSYKAFLNIFLKLENITNKENKVMIKWYYPAKDDDLLESGEEFQSLVDISFEFIPKN